MGKTKVSFEENLRELENIVQKLESGDVSLGEMLGLFEQGISRTKECNEQIKNAEQKISFLLKNSSGELEEKPMEGTNEF